MALTIPPNFKNDIESNHTNIYPFVVIDLDGLNIRISTNAITIGDDFHKPLLLNVPSLKESIDLETRKYKINSVTLDISNVEYEGTRFSDLASSKSLMNAPVLVKWGSPSTTDYDTGFTVYNGTIRRYTHTDDKVKIELEDRSQAYLHKDLPITNLGSDDNVPDKYKNKPIPMVYGRVENSPLVAKYNNNRLEFIADSRTDVAIQGSEHLTLYENEKYISIPFQINADVDDEYIFEEDDYEYKNNILQWQLSGSYNSILLVEKTDSDNFNPINDDRIVGFHKVDLQDMKINPLMQISDYWTNAGWGGHGGRSWYNSLYYDEDGTKDVFGTILTEKEPTDWDGGSRVDNPSPPNAGLQEDTNIYTTLYNGDPTADDDKHQRALMGCVIDTSTVSGSSFLNSFGIIKYLITLELVNMYSWGSGSSDSSTIVRLRIGGNKTNDLAEFLYLSGTGFDGNEWKEATDIYANSGTEQTLKIENPNSLLIYAMLNQNYGNGIVGSRIRMHSLNLKNYLLIDSLIDQDYYAGLIVGRNSSITNDVSTPDAILDILENELGVDENSLDQAPNFSVDMNYAFTIDKKINSKKLIEELASASPFIPHFNNHGNFKFDVIPATNPTADHTIQESKVIDFTFKRTKVENVKTKVEVKYKWDYARGEFGKSVVASLGDGNTGLDYSAVFNYYKLESDHSQSTLVVDDHRGKYIRDSATAKNLANFLLDYHMNQHLILSVKLPLSAGLVMEVGDIVEFDSLLGGIKPYGIDYRSNAQASLNNQNLFPKFIITNTNKTLELVTIECEMLHKLMQVDHLYDEEGTYDLSNADTSYQQQIDGCTLEGSTNYDPDATNDDGSCTGFSLTPICETGTTRNVLVGDDYIQQSANNTEDHQYHTTSSGEEYQTTVHDASVCTFPDIVGGCMDSAYDNYDANATYDDGSCQFLIGCNVWNAENVSGYSITNNSLCNFLPTNHQMNAGWNIVTISKPLTQCENYVFGNANNTWQNVLWTLKSVLPSLNSIQKFKWDADGYPVADSRKFIVSPQAFPSYGTFPNGDTWNNSSTIWLEELEILSGNNTFQTYEENEIFWVIDLADAMTTDFVRHLLYEDNSQFDALELFFGM